MFFSKASCWVVGGVGEGAGEGEALGVLGDVEGVVAVEVSEVAASTEWIKIKANV
jgi:hypothetical protein